MLRKEPKEKNVKGYTFTLYLFKNSVSLINRFNMRFRIAKIIADKIAIPKPLITNVSPMNACVNIKVIALITNKKKPSETIVMGNVSKTKIGFTITFKTDKIRLASNAVPNPSR